jgi:membrane protein DedA with SNARE-associated domain
MPEWISHLSYLGIILVLTLTGVGLPIPEELPVIAAGVASHNGQMFPWFALASCLVGALIGDCLMYTIGYHFGRSILNEYHWFARSLTPEREGQIERMIARHGWKVFLVARFMVGLRSPVYVTAGILRVPFRRFVLIDSFCATLVVSTFFGLSYYFASHIETLWRWIHNSQYALTFIVVVAALGFVGWWLWYRRHRHVEGHSHHEEPSAHSPRSIDATSHDQQGKSADKSHTAA